MILLQQLWVLEFKPMITAIRNNTRSYIVVALNIFLSLPHQHIDNFPAELTKTFFLFFYKASDFYNKYALRL